MGKNKGANRKKGKSSMVVSSAPADPQDTQHKVSKQPVKEAGSGDEALDDMADDKRYAQLQYELKLVNEENARLRAQVGDNSATLKEFRDKRQELEDLKASAAKQLQSIRSKLTSLAQQKIKVKRPQINRYLSQEKE